MLPEPLKRPRLRGSGVPFAGMALVGCLPSPLKRAWYRWRGATIGRNVALGLFSYIQSPEIVLADGVSIAPFTFIRTRSCRIGARSAIHAFTAIDTGAFTMGEDSAIGEQVVVGGLLTPRSALTIGHRTKIFSYSFINPTEPVTIGDEVCIGGGNYIFTHGTWQSMLDGFPGSFGPVTVKSGAWVAWRSFIMPNVTIGEEATVGAGSVVTRDVPARTLALGAPAKPVKQAADYIRTLDEGERHALLLRWFGEFADFLTYLGRRVAFTHDDSGAVVRVAQPGGREFVIVYRRQASATANVKADILVSLAAIGETGRRGLQGWFDIAARECKLVSHPLWAELRNFLTRYGVRFSVVDSL